MTERASSDLRGKKRLFSGVVEWSYEASLPLSPVSLQRMTTALFAPPFDRLSHGASLKDLKGRDLSSPCEPRLTAHLPPTHEELVALSGSLAIPDTNPRTKDKLPTEPFQYALITQFEAFEGSHHIMHGSHQRQPDSFPAWFTPATYACAIPLCLEAVRVGLELFSSRFSSLSFGYSPVVDTRVLFECVADRCRIAICAEASRHQLLPLLSRRPEIAHLTRVCDEMLGWSLLADIEMQHRAVKV